MDVDKIASDLYRIGMGIKDSVLPPLNEAEAQILAAYEQTNDIVQNPQNKLASVAEILKRMHETQKEMTTLANKCIEELPSIAKRIQELQDEMKKLI